MTILIEDLKFAAILGILPFERTTPQSIRIDCTLGYTYEEGAFINYADVAALIVETMQEGQFELIETALTALSSALKTRFPRIETLTLTIRKPDILSNCSVGVQQNFSF